MRQDRARHRRPQGVRARLPARPQRPQQQPGFSQIEHHALQQELRGRARQPQADQVCPTQLALESE